MNKFFTRQKSNEGKKFPLYYPDGTASEFHLIVVGIDSDIFKRAEATAKRQAVDLATIKDQDERADKVREIETKMIARLVTGWNLEEEFTYDNVVKFLTEAPQIAEMVNRVSANRIAFFGQK